MRGVRSLVSRHLAWPAYRLLHPSVRAATRLLPEMTRWYRLPQDEVDRRQTAVLKDLLEQAQAHVPYYRDLFRQIGFSPGAVRGLADLRAVPPLTRQDVQTRCEALRTDRPDVRLLPNASGGSSGSPVIVYQTRESGAYAAANTVAADTMAGYEPGRGLASLWGAHKDVSKSRGLVKHAVLWALNYELYDAFNMDEQRMARYHRRLCGFRPEVLLGYAGALHVFAGYLREAGLKPEYPHKALISSAEILTPTMREDIESVFGRPVFNRYGGRETSIIAMECERHEGLHVLSHNVLVEVVDPDSLEPVRDQPGEILVTTLRNTGMPLVRYRIGDFGVLSDAPCPCGRPGPILKEVLGRTFETIRMPSGRLVNGGYFTTVVFGMVGVREYRFVQEDACRYRLYLVTDNRYDCRHDAAILEELEGVGGPKAKIEVVHVDRLEPLPSGKRQYVFSRLAGRDSRASVGTNP